jgi:putative membrane protein
MGCADLVPGISGGTMAFLLGIYSDLIESIDGFSRGKLVEPLRFLIPLALGMGSAFLLLSPLIHWLLEDETYSIALYFIFFFLLLFATRKTYGDCTGHSAKFLILGALLVGITRFLSPATMEAVPTYLYCAAGLLAVVAMLLPGISGSTLLLIFGMYKPIIGHLSAFSLALREGFFLWSAFLPLLSFGVGVLIGALFGARLIHTLMDRFPSQTMSTLIGLMAGGAFVLWPLNSAIPPLLLLGLTFLAPGKTVAKHDHIL